MAENVNIFFIARRPSLSQWQQQKQPGRSSHELWQQWLLIE
jgi:hypothetical protein